MWRKVGKRVRGCCTSGPWEVALVDSEESLARAKALGLPVLVLGEEDRAEAAARAFRAGATDYLPASALSRLSERVLELASEAGPSVDAAWDLAFDALLVLDSEGKIVRANRSAGELLGFDPIDVTGREFELHLSPRSRSAFRRTCGLGDRAVVGEPLEAVRTDGGSTPVGCQVGRAGRGWSVALRDLSLDRERQESSRRNAQRLQALGDIERMIAEGTDLEPTLHLLLDHLCVQLGVDAATISLIPRTLPWVEPSAVRGFRCGPLPRLRLDEGLVGRALRERRAIVEWELGAMTASGRADVVQHEGFKGLVVVPLDAKGKTKGVLELFFRSRRNLGVDWLEFLQAMTTQAAVALDNAELLAHAEAAAMELRVAYDKTIDSWVRMIDLRDHETEGHSQRTTEMTLRLAQRFGLSDAELQHVKRGALLHDVGKIGIPDHILLKPGPLDDGELEQMRRHTVLAHNMLHEIDFLRPALDIPYCHHERWDGRGYPRGLAKHDIPLAARLFSVVDVWDALRSNRPYRKGWDEGEALGYVLDESGSHFDPKVVREFVSMVRN